MSNSLIVKANDLIQARYELTLNEQKIILYAVSKLDTNKDNFNIISLNVKEFFKLLNTSTERYTELREIVKELISKTLVIDTGEGEIISTWLSSLEYKRNTGVIELEFSNKLIPYLLQLKKNFTRYQIKNILYLSNKHSIRIYELLKQYETISKRTFKVYELKKILLLENQYSRFYDFERYVLTPTMEEINEHTDILISYEKIKRGRSIDSIKYTIKPKLINEEEKYLNELYNIKDMKLESGLDKENFNSEQFMKLYTVASNKMQDEYETGKDILSYININYKEMLKKNNIVNRFSYLMDMLENDRARAIFYIRTNKKSHSKIRD